MAEINHINLIALKSLKSEFDGECAKFTNMSYPKFSSSYFFTTSNPIVSRMGDSLNKIYKDLNKGYKNIDKWWTGYNVSIEELENLLSKKSTVTTELDSSIVSFVNQRLLGLSEEGKMELQLGLFSKTADTKSFNAVFSMNTDFSALYREYEEPSEEEVVIEDKRNWFEKSTDWIATESADMSKKVADVFVSTSATVTNATLGFVEGVGEFGEALSDAGKVLQTSIYTIPTAAFDLVKMGSSELFGTDYESTTAAMWEDTKAYVAKKHVDTFFSETVRGDHFFGDYLRESYMYEEVRGVSSSVGYMAGAIAVSAVTGIPPFAISGTAGFGQGTEKAWAEGGTVGEGLLTGTFTGAKDAVQYLIGGKMVKVGAPFAKKYFSEATVKVLDAGFRATVDGLAGAAEAGLVPLIDVVYKKGFYDETGNYVNFTDQSLVARYEELFNDAGGWNSVTQGAIAGAAMSGLMETIPMAVSGIKTKFNKSQIKNNNVTPPIIDLGLGIVNPNNFIRTIDEIKLPEFRSNKKYDSTLSTYLESSSIKTIGNHNIFEFNYFSNGKSTKIYSDQNILDMIPLSNTDLKNKIFSDFLSPERVFSKESGYIGNMILNQDGKGYSKYLNESLENKIRNSDFSKSLMVDRVDGSKFKLEAAGNVTHQGVDLFAFKFFSADYIDGINIYSQNNLIKNLEIGNKDLKDYISNTLLHAENMPLLKNGLANFTFNTTNGKFTRLIDKIDEDNIAIRLKNDDGTSSIIKKVSKEVFVGRKKINGYDIDVNGVTKKIYTEANLMYELENSEAMESFVKKLLMDDSIIYKNFGYIGDIKQNGLDFTLVENKGIVVELYNSLVKDRVEKITAYYGGKNMNVITDLNRTSLKQREVDIEKILKIITDESEYQKFLKLSDVDYAKDNTFGLYVNAAQTLLSNSSQFNLEKNFSKVEIYRINKLNSIHSKKMAEINSDISIKTMEWQLRDFDTLAIDGDIKIISPKNLDKNLQKIEIERLIARVNDMPPVLRKTIKEIYLLDVSSPDNQYWQYAFGNPNHVAAASAGDGTMYIWKECNTDDARLASILNHEAGHFLDNEISKSTGTYYAESPEWKKAIESDKEGSGFLSPTEYGKSSSREDLAESISYFYKNAEYLEKNFPNRFKLLLELLDVRKGMK